MSVFGGNWFLFGKAESKALAARASGDMAAVLRYRAGLQRVLGFVKSRPDVFGGPPGDTVRLLPREARGTACRTWNSLLDYYLALDSLGQHHKSFYKIRGKQDKRNSFLVGYVAFLAEYRYALEFIDLIERDPGLDKLLNDPIPEFGTPEGAYAQFKFRFLNVGRAAEFATLNAIRKLLGTGDDDVVKSAIDEDAGVIWEMGKGRGEMLTGKNALAVIKRSGLTAWFPVQSGVAEWMGDTKVWRRRKNLITRKQIVGLPARLAPGDVFFERREWHLSNVGIPGFWTHLALYIGDAATRRAYFADPEVEAWVREQGQADGDFEALLEARHAEAYAKSKAPYSDGHGPRVIEAIAPGVTFTSLEKSAKADSFGVLRPRLSKRAKAVAVLRAFHYAGRPYDYDFDFRTDTALVCSELVYKCYESGEGCRGLLLPVEEVAGRPVLPPNAVVRDYDATAGADRRQFDFVLFLDGYERGGKALAATEAEFRASWQRPKWHVFFRKMPEAQ